MKKDTDGPYDFRDVQPTSADDVRANWWKFFSGYRLKQWRNELERLSAETGRSLEQVCAYLGISYTREIGFVAKMPRKRTMFIGIGMAFGQPLEVIDQWIMKFGAKQRLYVKDVREDLAWIHLIQANHKDQGSTRNYFRMHADCTKAVMEMYERYWQVQMPAAYSDADLLNRLGAVPYDERFTGLQEFLQQYAGALTNAYCEPRKLLDRYVRMILRYINPASLRGNRRSLSALRGYLDDSMVNYLSGDPDCVHVTDRESGELTVRFKQIPRSKKTHISIALALGMTRQEMDQYLEMMGFSPLDAVDQNEGFLANLLMNWESDHLCQRRLKDFALEAAGRQLGAAEASDAVHEILQLRQDMKEEYEKRGLHFPYMSS